MDSYYKLGAFKSLLMLIKYLWSLNCYHNIGQKSIHILEKKVNIEKILGFTTYDGTKILIIESLFLIIDKINQYKKNYFYENLIFEVWPNFQIR